MKKKPQLTDEQINETVTAGTALGKKLARAMGVDDPDPDGDDSLVREFSSFDAEMLGEEWLTQSRVERAQSAPPPSTAVVVDGTIIWKRPENPVRSPLRYDWTPDGLVIANARVERERREAVERLKEPPPSAWSSNLAGAVVGGMGALVYGYAKMFGKIPTE